MSFFPAKREKVFSVKKRQIYLPYCILLFFFFNHSCSNTSYDLYEGFTELISTWIFHNKSLKHYKNLKLLIILKISFSDSQT